MKNMLLRRRIMLGLASSPFSPEATAILKEDFPNEWNDIKAYGYANSEMVPYINEDPYIICSLIDIGVIRFLVGDGEAYINTGYIKPLNTSIEIDWALHDILSNKVVISQKSSKGDSAALLIQSLTNLNIFRVAQGSNGTSLKTYDTNFEVLNDVLYKQILTKDTFTSNGVTITTGISASGTPSAPILFYANGNGDSVLDSNIFDVMISKVVCGNDRLWVPCKNPNGSDYGMLDTINLVYYPNTKSSGAFTIEYSGRPYLNITSTTKTYIINTYGENAWNTVKEFFTNPNNEYLVKYVNNDPDIVCNLVDIGYTRYLVGDGAAYIDSGFTCDQNSRVRINFKKSRTGGVFGSRQSSTSRAFTILITTVGNLNIYYSGTSKIYPDISENTLCNVDLNKNVLTVNNTQHIFNAATFTCPTNAYISAYYNGSEVLASSHPISKTIINDNGVLIRNFIPCKNLNGNDYGMLDIVNDVFYPNANNSGAFTVLVEQNS